MEIVDASNKSLPTELILEEDSLMGSSLPQSHHSVVSCSATNSHPDTPPHQIDRLPQAK
jgi:hypothetical protein